MVFRICLICTLLVLNSSCEKELVSEPPNSSFQKFYGTQGNEIGNEILEFNEYLYLVGYSQENNQEDLLFIKTDLKRNQIYYNKIGAAGNQQGQAICKTSEGNFLLLGSTDESGSGNRNVYLNKVKPNGQLLWSKSYGGSKDDYGVDVLELTNGNYFILANTNSKGNGDLDIWMIWLDKQGNIIREKTHGGIKMDGGAESIELGNGDLINFCYTWNYGAISRDFYLLKTNALGDSIWAKHFAGTDYEESQNMNITPEGDILLIGHSASTDPRHDMYVVKLDADGTLLWEKNFGGPMHDGGQCQLISSTGNYVFVGRSTSFSQGDRNAYMITANTNGEVLEAEIIGNAGDDKIDDIIEYKGYYYLLGHSNSFGAGQNDVWLVKKRI